MLAITRMSENESNLSDNENDNFKLTKSEEFWQYRDDQKQNYRRPIVFPDENNHITEYLQIKLTKRRNFFIDKKYRDTIKLCKLLVNKNNDIFDSISNKPLLEILYPNFKLVNINFKNGCKFNFHKINIKLLINKQ